VSSRRAAFAIGSSRISAAGTSSSTTIEISFLRRASMRDLALSRGQARAVFHPEPVHFTRVLATELSKKSRCIN
jgi:hypothetical protein